MSVRIPSIFEPLPKQLQAGFRLFKIPLTALLLAVTLEHLCIDVYLEYLSPGVQV